jgi:hypothetical protein
MQFVLEVNDDGAHLRLMPGGLQITVFPGDWPTDQDGERTVIRIESKDYSDKPPLVVRVDNELVVNRY